MARILMLDDDLDILRVGQKILNKFNHQVVVSQSKDESEVLLKASNFDLLISDCNIGASRELDFVTRLRECSRNKFLKVMILSGQPDVRQLVLESRLNVDKVLEKPLDPLELANEVGELVHPKLKTAAGE